MSRFSDVSSSPPSAPPTVCSIIGYNYRLLLPAPGEGLTLLARLSQLPGGNVDLCAPQAG